MVDGEPYLMTIEEYLRDTQHAAATLINAFTAEWKAHVDAALEYNKTVDEFKDMEKLISRDATGFAGLHQLSEAFQKSRERYVKMRKFHEDRLEKVPSTTVLCGSLLQIAKQGLSSVHGARTGVLHGRAIGGTTLGEVIWQSRNQAMHYEEGNYNAAVQTCFAALVATFGPQFSLGTTNLSVHIIDVLGWHTLAKYEADMRTL